MLLFLYNSKQFQKLLLQNWNFFLVFYDTFSSKYFILNIRGSSMIPLTQDVNWTYIRHSEDVQDIFWTSYVRSIDVQYLLGIVTKLST